MTDAAGSGWLDIVHEEDKARVQENWLEHVRSGRSFYVEYRIKLPADEVRWVGVRGVPLCNDDGRIEEWIGTVVDIHNQKVSDDELRSREERLRLALEATELGIWDVDLRTGARTWTERTRRILGVSDHVPPTYEQFIEIVSPKDRERVKHASVLKGGPFTRLEYKITRANDKEERAILGSSRVIRSEAGEPTRILGTLRDITDQNLAQEKIRDSEERLRLALNAGRMIAWSVDLETELVSIPESGVRLFGIESNLLSRFLDFVVQNDRDRVRRFIHEAGPQPSDPIEFQFNPPGSSTRWIEMRARRSHPNRVIGVTFDIEDRKEAERKTWHIANHDSLTSLPNRAFFKKKFERALLDEHAHGKKIGLILIDLDNFKDINDTLGHQAGDAVLVAAAMRLLTFAEPSGFVARLGGDEFALMTPPVRSTEEIYSIAMSISAALRDPVTYEGTRLSAKGSLGVSVFPDHGESPIDLMKNADIALYRAKANGRGRVVCYASEMREAAEARLRTTAEVQRAIELGQIVPFYQPKVCLSTGRLIGFEALARWLHPAKGILSAGTFADAFEDFEIATALGQCILRRVVSDIRNWLDKGLDCGRVAVNFSAAEFANSDLASETISILMSNKVPLQRFEVEVTETVFLGKQSDATWLTLKRFQDSGIHVALDDFGTGFASLTHLRRFPVDHIKIDQSFVRDLEQGGGDEAIVRAVIGLGKGLNLSVTAEGVETAGQAQILRNLGCDFGQGYFFARPADAAEITRSLMAMHTNAGGSLHARQNEAKSGPVGKSMPSKVADAAE